MAVALLIATARIRHPHPLMMTVHSRQRSNLRDWKVTTEDLGPKPNGASARGPKPEPPPSFLHPTTHPELHGLVRGWNFSSFSSIAVDEAARALDAIVAAPEYRSHRPSEGVVFVKTHKTGSSTVASALRSAATAHGLAAPVFCGSPGETVVTWDAGRKGKLEKMMNFCATGPRARGAPYDVWAGHAYYDDALRERIVPSATRVLSIVRDPASRVRSACGYFHCCPYDAANASVWNEFVLSEGSAKFFKRLKRDSCKLERMSRLIVGNGLGGGRFFGKNFRKVVAAVRRGEFVLLVMERMVESMLALWSEYGLHPLDVAFLPKKVRSRSVPEGGRDERTPMAEAAMRELNPHDLELYELANRRLDEYMGDAFANSTAALEQAKEDLTALNTLVEKVCSRLNAMLNVMDGQTKTHYIFYAGGGTFPDLEYWCSEKQLDSKGWHREHTLMLEGRSRWNGAEGPGFPEGVPGGGPRSDRPRIAGRADGAF